MDIKGELGLRGRSVSRFVENDGIVENDGSVFLVLAVDSDDFVGQCIHAIEVKVQEGEVDMEEVLGLRSVLGFAGIEGPVFLVGEVDKDDFVGDLDPDDAGLAVDCDPICSHCFNRSATLPVLVGPLLPSGFVGEATRVISGVGAGIATVGFRTGRGG